LHHVGLLLIWTYDARNHELKKKRIKDLSTQMVKRTKFLVAIFLGIVCLSFGILYTERFHFEECRAGLHK